MAENIIRKNQAQPLFDLRYFTGINNHDDPEKVLPRGQQAPLVAGTNIDIDNVGMIHRREGYAAPSYTGNVIHSLWGNGETCLFVEGSDLKILNPDYTGGTIRAGVGTARMRHAEAARRVYYTNGVVIGYVEDRTGFTFPEPTMTYRKIMPPGHLIEWFNGRLYVAVENEIWASDPVYPGQTHVTEGFKKFGSRIRMMRGIKETGLVVSDSGNVYLLAGLDFKEFTVSNLADFPAILGTDVKLDGAKLPAQYPTGDVILWLSENGFCAAGKGGFYQAITIDTYHPALTVDGSAIVRLGHGHYQYLVTQGV